MPGQSAPPGILQPKNLFLNKTLCTQSLFNLLLVGVTGLHQRQTALAGLPAQHVHSILHRDGIHFTEQCISQRQHFQLQLTCLGGIAVKESLAAVVHQLRLDIGDNTDDAIFAT